MKIVIITNGNKPSAQLAKDVCKQADVVYCCDGAAEFAKQAEIKIDILLGDMDSISVDTLKFFENSNIEIIKLPTEKDATDTQFAADLAAQKGANEIIFLGAVGSRIDHSLGNMHILERLFKIGISAKLIDDNNIIYIIGEGRNEILGEKGKEVSILSVKGSVFINSTEGLYYPIKDRALFLEEPLGISNVFLSDKAYVDVKSGEAFILISKD